MLTGKGSRDSLAAFLAARITKLAVDKPGGAARLSQP